MSKGNSKPAVRCFSVTTACKEASDSSKALCQCYCRHNKVKVFDERYLLYPAVKPISESEQARVNRKICTGIHKNCNLYLTDGILQSPVIKNNQYRFSQLQFEKNKAYYGNNHWIIKRNISVLAESLKRAFIIRKDDSVSRSDAGQLVPEGR